VCEKCAEDMTHGACGGEGFTCGVCEEVVKIEGDLVSHIGKGTLEVAIVAS